MPFRQTRMGDTALFLQWKREVNQKQWMKALENRYSNACSPMKKITKRIFGKVPWGQQLNNEEFQQQWETVKIIEKGKNNASETLRSFRLFILPTVVIRGGFGIKTITANPELEQPSQLVNPAQHCHQGSRPVPSLAVYGVEVILPLTCSPQVVEWLLGSTCFLVHLQQEREAVFFIASLLKMKKVLLRYPQGTTSWISLLSLGSHHHP